MQRQLVLHTCIFLLLTTIAVEAASDRITWRKWSNEALLEAKRQKRFVILDLRAVWCHWCHVMDETTYSDPKVVALIEEKYLPLQADQDANPDLSTRYGDWGWPATIIFGPDGSELVKRRGYIPPENMAGLLQAVIDDPTPGPSVVRESAVKPSETLEISAATRKQLEARVTDSYDAKNGGWGDVHKYIDTDSMDWTLRHAERGDAIAANMARTTFDRATALIDPVWGGIYQYSDAEDWSSPHYEKIMWYQANSLREYSFAYALFKDARYLKASNAIYQFMTTKLLAPEGGFYCSQDADVDQSLPGKNFYRLTDVERKRASREPAIDTNIYARETGWAISGLVAFANATGRTEPLAQAETAADWVIAHRRRADGIFAHGDKDHRGPFLSDTVAMGNAVVDLYAATGDRKWLEEVNRIRDALKRFQDPEGGFRSSMTPEGDGGALSAPFKGVDEQVQVARLATRIWHYLGDALTKDVAEHALKYVTSPDFIVNSETAPGILLAIDEFEHEPTHITIVGHKDDAEARTLDAAARAFPASYKRVDWWDKREGPLLNADVTYPDMDRSAAFACGNRLCSLPVFTAEDLAAAITQMTKAASTDPDR